MMRRHAATFPLVLLLAAAVPAGADWLVTRAGGKVETQGHWEVKGKLVVFKGANGALASLRLADVDLTASQAATSEAKEAKEKVATAAQEPPKPPERKKSIRSLTDADFSHKPAAGEASADDPAKGAKDKDKEKEKGASDAKPAADEGKVVVQSWSKADRTEGDGIDIFGTLQNTGLTLAANVVLKVTLLNEQKETVGTAEGVLAATSIPGGGTTSFRVPFTGVFTFAQARFDVTNRTITVSPAPPSPAAKKPAPPANGKP
jgi:hypothetical protein